MTWQTALVTLAALVTSLGTVYLGIQKGREDRAKRLSDTSEAGTDRAVAVLTTELAYWRDRAEKQEARAEELQQRLFTMMTDADHAADVAAAALLSYRQATRGKEERPS